MRPLFLALLLLGASAAVARAQDAVQPLQRAPEGTRIGIADVSPTVQLSAELLADITALVGTPLQPERLEAIAMRIESEKPDMIVAIRRTLLPGGEARVTFVVAQLNDTPEVLANINSRYLIESVTFSGIDEKQIPADTLTQVRNVVGGKLDPKEGDRLTELLVKALPGYEVKRRFERGNEAGQLRLIFDVTRKAPPSWIRFAPSHSKILYHAFQGWSAALDIPITVQDFRFTFGFAIADEDALIEQFSGYRVRVEARKLGTRRLGAAIEFSDSDPTWREATLAAVAADPTIPAVYEERRTVEPTLTFAVNPHLRVTGGLSTTTLDPFFLSTPTNEPSRQANAGIASISFDQSWTRTGVTHEVEASYELRAASSTFDSDLDYTRHFFAGGYRFRQGRSALIADWTGGHARGELPLFERFAVGDTRTLRGWNKFDLSPAGGTRLFHQTLEYRYRIFAIFLDSGSVWTRETSASTKFSTGFGLHSDHVLLMLGVPLNQDDTRVSFMMGVRF